MMRRVVSLSVVFGLWVCAAAAAQEWQVAKGPLLTRWAKDVSPEKAWPEYPRPQMVRTEWQNLNGLWEYAIKGKEDAKPAQYDGKILVPYPVESALSGVMKRVDQNQRLWYRRTFTVPAGWEGKRVWLHFGAVDWDTTVWVNGKELGNHQGGYDPFSFDMTDALKSGEQELVVGVLDPTNSGSQPRGKQVHRPGGIFYTPTTGIWQTVWMEPVSAAGIEKVVVTPDVDKGSVSLAVVGKGITEGHEVAVVITGGGQRIEAKVKGKQVATVGVPNAKLWTPEDPFLYDVKVSVLDGQGKVLDTIGSYFGMRKIGLAKDEKGILRIMLNNRFVFQVGFLDQGFWPDGLYTPATDEAMRYDIEMTKKLGMNMARKHVKYECSRWYYWCDKLGLLVWQDMPAGDNKTPESRKQYELELGRMIDTLYNHPSIIMWVVFNEGWGQYDTERLTEWTKQRDPSRLVNNASGWTDKKVGDVIDMHNYPGPGSPKPEEKRAAVLGEFGGLGLAVEGHTWSSQSWGYKGMGSQARLTNEYSKLLVKAYQLKDDPGLCAVVYTQTSDVETECNGLMTYDREMVKGDLERLRAANLGKGTFEPEPEPTVLVATSQKEAATWRYTTERPGEGWFRPEYDASGWKEGKGGFGTEGTPGAVVGTVWNTSDIWLRREFEMPAGEFKNLSLFVHHDEDVEIYINGVLAARKSGYTTEYETLDLRPAGKQALKAGKNTMAVHCRQTGGGQFIDVGIVDVK